MTQVEPLYITDLLMKMLGRYMILTDQDFGILELSHRLPELLGYSKQALMGVHIQQLFFEPFFQSSSPLVQALQMGKRKEGWRAHLKTASAQEISLSMSVAPILEPLSIGGARAPKYLVVLRPDALEDGDFKESCQLGPMITRSPKMMKIFKLINQLYESDASVLITGESGTGKELVAKAIHQRSHRSQGPFVVINCGAIPEHLLESEFFGHVRGAFTGAYRDRKGRFESADGGTLFLDEIGDLPLNLQVKLLRVLQDQSFERIGENRTRQVDVRIIAATHVDLQKAVGSGQFRQDLYYRLKVLPIQLPPLRERREDIELLTRALLDKIGKRRGRSLRLSPEVLKVFFRYPWPGNIRELENVLEYATAVCEGQTIHKRDLPEELWIHRETQMPMHNAAEEERERILEALKATQWHRQKAADQLGISRWTLWRKIKEYGIVVPSKKSHHL